MNSEKKYIAVHFDGWHWHHCIMPDGIPLKTWMTDGSFDDQHEPEKYKWQFYELGRELTKQELTDIANELH